MINDSIKVTGELKLTLTRPDGHVKHEVIIPNLVVTTGKNYIASRMKDASATAMTHMAIGTGTVDPVVGDTTLGTEVARVALTDSGGIVAGAVITFAATYPADTPDVTAPATAAITEAGILNAASAGTMLARTEFTAVNKGELDTMTISWAVTIS